MCDDDDYDYPSAGMRSQIQSAISCPSITSAQKNCEQVVGTYRRSQRRNPKDRRNLRDKRRSTGVISFNSEELSALNPSTSSEDVTGYLNKDNHQSCTTMSSASSVKSVYSETRVFELEEQLVMKDNFICQLQKEVKALQTRLTELEDRLRSAEREKYTLIEALEKLEL